MITNTFVAGRGFLYHLDARGKLILLILFCIIVFLPIASVGLLLLCIGTFIIAWYATSFKQSFAILHMIIPLLVLMIVFAPFSYRNSPPALTIHTLTIITEEALEHVHKLILRFIGITYMCTLFLWTTPMGEITLAFRWFGLPYKATIVLTLAFRFIPYVADSFTMIAQAHQLRSANIDETSKKHSAIAQAIPTATASLVYALKTIPHIAMSLEHRGLSRKGKRSSYRYLSPPWGLFTHLVISVMIPTVFFIVFNTL